MILLCSAEAAYVKSFNISFVLKAELRNGGMLSLQLR